MSHPEFWCDPKFGMTHIYKQREVVVKIVLLQSFENLDESIHQSSNPPKSEYNNYRRH